MNQKDISKLYYILTVIIANLVPSFYIVYWEKNFNEKIFNNGLCLSIIVLLTSILIYPFVSFIIKNSDRKNITIEPKTQEIFFYLAANFMIGFFFFYIIGKMGLLISLTISETLFTIALFVHNYLEYGVIKPLILKNKN